MDISYGIICAIFVTGTFLSGFWDFSQSLKTPDFNGMFLCFSGTFFLILAMKTPSRLQELIQLLTRAIELSFIPLYYLHLIVSQVIH